MTIDKKKEGNRLVLAVSGRLDTMTAPELENVIKDLGRTARSSRSQEGYGRQGFLLCSQSLQRCQRDLRHHRILGYHYN